MDHRKYAKENPIVASKAETNEENKDESKQEYLDDEEDEVFEIDRDNLSSDDVKLLLNFEEQKTRVQNFELMFPVQKTFKKYLKFFQIKRYRNALLWEHVNSPLIDVDSYLA